ncbi:SH2 domain-containing protein [Chytriomyces sp. MP71]|nr:SH2 domain-containing protein [Chytriomyces sp. MP71]
MSDDDDGSIDGMFEEGGGDEEPTRDPDHVQPVDSDVQNGRDNTGGQDGRDAETDLGAEGQPNSDAKGGQRETPTRPRTKRGDARRRVLDSDDESGDEGNEEGNEEGNRAAKTATKRGAVDSDDSSVEDSDDEMTEADQKFIVDDDDVSEGGEDNEEDLDARERARQHRREKKRKQREEEEDLDEDDMDLINENYGRATTTTKKKLSKLRRVGAEEDTGARGVADGLADIFNEDQEAVAAQPKSRPSAREYESDEDSDDFVVNDMDDEVQEDETEEDRRKRLQQKRKERKLQKEDMTMAAREIGISVEVWEEIDELFGDGSDYNYALHPSSKSRDPDAVEVDDDDDEEERKPVKLTDIYEPSEIAERMLTEEDEVIRLKDVPERLQLRPEILPQSEEDLAREVTHIETTLLQSLPDREHPLHRATGTSRQAALTKALKFLNGDQKFEVPYLAAHRKDHFALLDRETGGACGALGRTDLWRVFDLDAAFQAVEAKRRAVRGLITDLRTSPELLGNAVVQEVLLQDEGYVDEMLRSGKTVEDIADVSAYLQLYCSEEIRKVEEAKGKRRELKRAVRRSEYEDARKFGLYEFVKLFGVNVRLFSESIALVRDLHNPEDVQEDPLDLASKFVKGAFNTEQRVIETARNMLAQQIAADPMFRRFLRKVYQDDAVVTVMPTERGKHEITPLHPYYAFKYIKDKPASRFMRVDRTQYLQIHKAESEGLVTVKVYVEEEAKLMEDVVRYITNDMSSELAERWNDERRRCAEKAMKEILFPAVVKWFKEMMAAKATEVLMEECRAKLEAKIDMQPFRRKANPDDFEDEEEEEAFKAQTHARVMAISWGDGDPQQATFAICLDEQGRVCDITKLSRMHMREAKLQDQDTILGKLREFSIEVIVIGGFSLSIKNRLLPDLMEAIRRINDADASRDSSGRRRYRRSRHIEPEVIMIEDDVARLSMNSKRYQKEFPEYPPLARYCVSLARRVQDTTLEFATLCNSEEEIKLVRVHPLQNLLPEEKLKAAFERAFLNVVGLSGVDINDAAAFPHRAGTLQFVSGLGPRKAAFVLQRINKTGGKLESRDGLVFKKIFARVIFINAASFIRIHRKHFERDESVLDVLDNTRVHPEDYEIARKMAAGAMDIDDYAEDPSGHVAELMYDRPERLNALLLEDFADELFRTNQELKKIALYDIRDEIIRPYAERRQPFSNAGWAEIFTMLTGETEDALVGMAVSCQVVKQFDRFFKCRLASSGLDANLQLSHMPISVDARLKENDTFQAVVIRVELNQFKCELDAREDILASGQWLKDLAAKTRDKYFNFIAEEEDKDRKPIQPKVAPKPKRTRTVNHPYWKNCTYDEAINELTGPSVRNGSLIIRPSTKGNDHICITWKVDEGLFQHIDILETKKENEWTLGKTLVIEGKKFDDLEEIIAMYVEPMAQHFAEARKHVKYRNEGLEETLRFVEREMQSKKRSSYAVIPAPNKSHCLILVFQHVGKSPRNEYVTVVPEGFKFRNAVHKRLDYLFDAFKKQEATRMKEAAQVAARQRQDQQKRGSGPSSGYPQGSGSQPRPQPPMRSGGAPMSGQYPGSAMPQRPVMAHSMGPGMGMPPARPPGMMYGQPPPQAGWGGGPPPMRPGSMMPPQPMSMQQGPPQRMMPQQAMGYRPTGQPGGAYYGR